MLTITREGVVNQKCWKIYFIKEVGADKMTDMKNKVEYTAKCNSYQRNESI